MITFQYVFLHILLVLILISYGKKISNSNVGQYWKLAIIPIAAFTVVVGLRWGREVDWNLYYYVYEDYLKGFDSNHEILFQAIWRSFAALGLPYYVVIASTAYFLIFSLVYFFKPHKRILYLLLPLTVTMCAGYAENLIRWYMAFSFLLVAMGAYQREKHLRTLFFCVCSVCTHIGMIVMIPIFYVLLNYGKVVLKPFPAILISFFLSVAFTPEILGKLSFILDLFSNVDRFAGYATNASDWLTGAGQNIETNRASILKMLLISIPMWFFIWAGYKLCKSDSNFNKLYNLMVLGIFIKNISNGLELMSRYYQMFIPFICIMFSYVMVYLYRRRMKNTVYTMAFLACTFYIARNMVIYVLPLPHESFMHYVWDKQITPNKLIQLYITIYH